LAKRLKSLWPVLIGICTIASLSFLFSVFYTPIAPEEAYFHPGTRIWEFLAGVIVALIYPLLSQASSRLLTKAWSFLAVAALVVFLFIGVLVDPGIHFPGVVAMAPVLCAVILLIGGKVLPGGTVVNRLLSHRHLSYFG